MIYRVFTKTGERLQLEADYIQSDGSGTTLYTNDGGVVAAFFCGEVTRIYPASTIEETE